MRKIAALCVLIFGFAGGVLATFAQEAASSVPLPLPRPDGGASIAPSIAPPGPVVPNDQPSRIYQVACPALLSGLVEGEILPPLAEGACGLQSPLLVRAVFVNGQRVGFTLPITTNCQMATTMARWVAQIGDYTQAIFNAPVTKLVTGTSYMCRPRNNQPGANLSEHGLANALDISGFELGGGQRIELPQHWDTTTPEGRTMRFAHDAACGQFTTVLGPEANALHADHLHLDMGCHGRTCTYRLCE